jgi:hypothetical protein
MGNDKQIGMHTSVVLGFMALEVDAFVKGGFSEDLLFG